MRNRKKTYGKNFLAKGLFFVTMAVLFIVVLGYVVMYLWNAILPDVLGVRSINFWQAAGMLLLFRILFGGFRWGGFGKERHRSRRRYWKEKWRNMDDDERAKMKSKWKEYCAKKKE